MGSCGLLEGGGSLVLLMLSLSLVVVVLVENDVAATVGRDINRAAEGMRASDEREVVNSIIILADFGNSNKNEGEVGTNNLTS